MKYFVIRTKDEDEEQEILDLLDGRNLEWTEVSDPREYTDNQFSVHMTDGVLFTLSYAPNQSSTDDNLPSTSYGLQDMGKLSDTSNHHQSNPPVWTESNRYDAQQYPYSQSLDQGYGRYTSYQSHSPARNESYEHDAQQYDYSQSSAHSYEGYSMEDICIEKENETSSMEPMTSSALKRPMDYTDSKEKVDYTYQAKKPRRRTKCSADDIECQLCNSWYSSENRCFYYAQKHAASHDDTLGNEEIFDCPVDRCGFRHVWMFQVREHFKEKHKDRALIEANFKLTDEQKAKWVRHVKECFAEIDKKETIQKPAHKKREPIRKRKCKCGDLIVDESSKLRLHAIAEHIEDIWIYKCDQPRCTFKSKYRNGLTSHKIHLHRIKSKEVTEIPLTDDQEKEVADMIKRCFPDEE